MLLSLLEKNTHLPETTAVTKPSRITKLAEPLNYASKLETKSVNCYTVSRAAK